MTINKSSYLTLNAKENNSLYFGRERRLESQKAATLFMTKTGLRSEKEDEY